MLYFLLEPKLQNTHYCRGNQLYSPCTKLTYTCNTNTVQNYTVQNYTVPSSSISFSTPQTLQLNSTHSSHKTSYAARALNFYFIFFFRLSFCASHIHCAGNLVPCRRCLVAYSRECTAHSPKITANMHTSLSACRRT